MDIRNYLRKPIPSTEGVEGPSGTNNSMMKNFQNPADDPHASDSKDDDNVGNPSKRPRLEPSDGVLKKSMLIQSSELDVGKYVNAPGNIPDDIKYKLITNPWTPPPTYDFKNDVSGNQRPFNKNWLSDHKSWLVYSSHLKGALCKHCVVFQPKLQRGLQGSFIKNVFVRYKHFSEQHKVHINSAWHRDALERSQNFVRIINTKGESIIQKLSSSVEKQIESNRDKLARIISTIIYCGTHDLALRGKTSDSGNFIDLLSFRIESGDKILEEHLSHCKPTEKYISHRVQNELIDICGTLIREHIVETVKKCHSFSVLADETADISGTEQMSLGVRYVSNNTAEAEIREEFLGFVPLEQLDAKSIASSILKTLSSFGLDLNLLVGQGYDGCATMAGTENGVQKIINDLYPKALFFHCASHTLNLVIHDLNAVADIRNSIGTIKNIIVFFRESVLRRKLIPSIPLFCETRWSAKYKSIRIFAENFLDIVNALSNLSIDGKNGTTKQKAFQLYAAATTPTFLISLAIVNKYSALLEPITNILQGVEINIVEVKGHMDTLLDLFKKERNKCDETFSEIFARAMNFSEELEVQIKIPRRCAKQTMRSNYSGGSPEEYFRQSIFLPYLDSLITSLASRFSSQTLNALDLQNLLPKKIKTVSKDAYTRSMNNLIKLYQIDNFKFESLLWFDFWKKSQDNVDSITVAELLQKTKLFYPSIHESLLILLTLPCTTCTIERSFSTLRRVKSWLRSTMSENRLSGLCMMSVHRDLILADKVAFINKVVDRFGQNPRRIQFLFSRE